MGKVDATHMDLVLPRRERTRWGGCGGMCTVYRFVSGFTGALGVYATENGENGRGDRDGERKGRRWETYVSVVEFAHLCCSWILLVSGPAGGCSTCNAGWNAYCDLEGGGRKAEQVMR